MSSPTSQVHKPQEPASEATKTYAEARRLRQAAAEGAAASAVTGAMAQVMFSMPPGEAVKMRVSLTLGEKKLKFSMSKEGSASDSPKGQDEGDASARLEREWWEGLWPRGRLPFPKLHPLDWVNRMPVAPHPDPPYYQPAHCPAGDVDVKELMKEWQAKLDRYNGMPIAFTHPATWNHEEGRWQEERDQQKSESVYYDSDA